MQWKAARLEPGSSVSHPREQTAKKVDPGNKTQSMNHQDWEQMVEIVKWEVPYGVSGKFT